MTCVTIPDPLHQVSYSYNNHPRCTPSRTYHLHTMRQANVILQQETKDKGKTIEMSRIQIQTSACQWLITYQTKVLTTWLLNPPWWVHWQQKAQSLNFKSKTPWSTARRAKANEKLKKVI
jgi:hypothetical protein